MKTKESKGKQRKTKERNPKRRICYLPTTILAPLYQARLGVSVYVEGWVMEQERVRAVPADIILLLGTSVNSREEECYDDY